MSSTGASANRSNAIVVDASAVVDLLVNGPAAAALHQRMSAPELTLYAPELLDLEVLNTLRRGVLEKKLDVPTAEAAIIAYGTLPILRFAHSALILRIWALRGNFTAYDAAYIALAEAYHLPLITLDARLAKAAALTTVKVELFA